MTSDREIDVFKSTGIPANNFNAKLEIWSLYETTSFASFVLWKIAEMESMDKLPTSHRNILLSPIAQLSIVIVTDRPTKTVSSSLYYRLSVLVLLILFFRPKQLPSTLWWLLKYLEKNVFASRKLLLLTLLWSRRRDGSIGRISMQLHRAYQNA